MIDEQVVPWTEQWKQQGFLQGTEQGIEQGIERGIERGIEQGIERGLARGRQEGEAQLLLRQLTRKFGPLSGDTRARLEAADAEQLLIWGERLLTAVSLDEVFS